MYVNQKKKKRAVVAATSKKMLGIRSKYFKSIELSTAKT